MARMTVREARLIANTGEIRDPEKVDTATVRKVRDILAAADWRREGIQEALVVAEDEVAFRERFGI